MLGFGIYLMTLADYLTGRKRKREERRRCDVCGQLVDTTEEMEMHRRDALSDVTPREAA